MPQRCLLARHVCKSRSSHAPTSPLLRGMPCLLVAIVANAKSQAERVWQAVGVKGHAAASRAEAAYPVESVAN